MANFIPVAWQPRRCCQYPKFEAGRISDSDSHRKRRSYRYKNCSRKDASRKNQILIQERTVDGKTITRLIQGTSLNDIGLSSPAILVIRTKKSDIDAFAKGDLGFDQFRKRVQLITCPYLGRVAEQGDPFDLYRRSRSTDSRDRTRSAGSRDRR